jgi:hypothetical protein
MRPASDTAPVTISRRAILVASAVAPVAAVAGCRDRPPARPDPDAAAIAAARDTEQRLVAGYGAAGNARLRAEHLAHLTALGGVMPTTPAASVEDPASLAHASVPALQSAAIAAHAGHVAAVLASIAAAHLTAS